VERLELDRDEPSAVGPNLIDGVTRDPLEARYRRLVLVVTMLGGAWRVGYLVVTKWSRHLMLNDSLYYSSQALQNAHGHWFRTVLGDHPGAEHAPLTSVLLAPASLLPNHEFWQRATNTVVGIAVIPLIALVARRIGGRRIAVIAAVVAAIYPNLWMNDSLIMSETISTLLAVAALWLALRHRDRFDWRSSLWCGAMVGLCALARSELVVLAPLFALIGFRSHPFRVWLQRGAVLLVAALVVLVPWVAYNLPRFDHVVLITTNEGGALRGANCDDVYHGPALGGWSVLCVIDDVDRPLEDASGRAVRLRHEALTYMRQHASRVPVVVAARLLRSADLYGLGDLVRFDVGEERARWASWAGIVSWWLLAPLAAVGWWRQRRRNGWILIAPVIGVVVTTIVFYGAHRLRSPMEPVVVLCAAVALGEWSPIRSAIDRWSTR
jgi:4-amino-4-deoxy-L-arabinose transferase-like glycosyltransferase